MNNILFTLVSIKKNNIAYIDIIYNKEWLFKNDKDSLKELVTLLKPEWNFSIIINIYWNYLQNDSLKTALSDLHEIIHEYRDKIYLQVQNPGVVKILRQQFKTFKIGLYLPFYTSFSSEIDFVMIDIHQFTVSELIELKSSKNVQILASCSSEDYQKIKDLGYLYNIDLLLGINIQKI